MGECRLGTSGWSYRDWRGLFYPKGTRQGDFLSYYAQHFSTVELNATFYRLPTDKTVAGWLDKVPPSFRFCAKLSRSVSHRKDWAEAPERIDLFSRRLAPLSPRLGPVLVQLPPSRVFDARWAERLLATLRARCPHWRFALEARHSSWFDAAALALLREHGVAAVTADAGGRYPQTREVTADFAYVRLHGPGGYYNQPYDDAALDDWARHIRRLRDSLSQVWVFFNNTDGGHALSNLSTLVQRLER